MKKLAVCLILFGLLPQVSDLNAANLFGGKIVLKANGKGLLERITDHQQDLAERISSHLKDLKEKNGGSSLDRLKLDCLPEWLQPNGPNGQAGREKPDYSSIWKHKIDLKNLCDKRLDFDQWCKERKPCVPEPSSALAGVLALGLGFAGWRRMRPIS